MFKEVWADYAHFSTYIDPTTETQYSSLHKGICRNSPRGPSMVDIIMFFRCFPCKQGD